MYGLTRARIQHGNSILEDATRAVCIPYSMSHHQLTHATIQGEFQRERNKRMC